MIIQTGTISSGNGAKTLVGRALGIFRQRYGLRETDRITRKVKRSLRVRGLGGTVKLCTSVFFKPSLRKHAVRPMDMGPSEFDLEFGVTTSGWLDAADLDVERHRRADTVGYQPTPPELVRNTIAALEIRPREFTFVDIGCGKGLTLLVASEYGFRKIVGVEFSQKLASIARENVSVYARQKPQAASIEVVTEDAREYALPDGPLVLFLYNPFTGESMKRLVEKVAAERAARPYDMYVIYIAAHERRYFRSFTLLKDSFIMIPAGAPSCPNGFASDYCIYKV